MGYSVEYSSNARKFVSKLAQPQRRMLLAWIDKNLVGTDNPRKHGRALHGNLKEYWRYRVADYRVLAEIQDDKVIVFIARIGMRDSVYNN